MTSKDSTYYAPGLWREGQPDWCLFVGRYDGASMPGSPADRRPRVKMSGTVGLAMAIGAAGLIALAGCGGSHHSPSWEDGYAHGQGAYIKAGNSTTEGYCIRALEDDAPSRPSSVSPTQYLKGFMAGCEGQ